MLFDKLTADLQVVKSWVDLGSLSFLSRGFEAGSLLLLQKIVGSFCGSILLSELVRNLVQVVKVLVVEILDGSKEWLCLGLGSPNLVSSAQIKWPV